MTESSQPPVSISPRRLVATGVGLLLVGAASLVAAGVLVGSAYDGDSLPVHDPSGRCELPRWASELEVTKTTADRLARWAVLCTDLDHGRIDGEVYQERVDALWTPRPQPTETTGTKPTVVWASAVDHVSSQYDTDSWSAAQILGPPNVYPTAGDSTEGWATADADGGIESITIRYSEAHPVRAVDIYETYNPGAVTRVELLDSDNHVVGEYSRKPARESAGSYQRTISFGCTDIPVQRVRITLDTASVAGWNEIDAVGIQPCI